METQCADKIQCSSKDLLHSVALKLQFYMETRRKEDGFDCSPSELPRRDYPPFFPRPMLRSIQTDLPLKHHFSHSAVRVMLSTLQSLKLWPRRQLENTRTERIQQELARLISQIEPENNSKNCSKTNKRMRQGNVFSRTPPDSISFKEKQRILRSASKLIFSAEDSSISSRRSQDICCTKLQRLKNPLPLQASFTPEIHRKFYKAVPRVLPVRSMITDGKRWYVYDEHGRRHAVMPKQVKSKMV